MSKETKVKLSMLEDENIEKEIKVLLLLEMVHQGEMGINKAKEICTQSRIFSDHWIAIDAKATEIFSRLHSSM